MVKEVKETKKLTLGLIVSWVLGVMFALAGLGGLVGGMIVSGISLILASVVILPPMNKLVKDKFNFELSKGLKITLVIILLIIYAVNANTSNISSQDSEANLNSNTQESISSNPSCTSNWQCTSWTECSTSGTQTRTCTDSNNCGTTKGRPAISQSCNYVYKMGDPIKAGDFTWKITNVYTTQKIGQDLMGTFMGTIADGKYIVLSVEVTNNANSAKYLMDSFVKLIDTQKREFSPDSMAAIYLDSNQVLMFEQLNPGITKKGKIVYDVPEEVDDFTFRIHSNLVSSSFSDMKLII